MNLKEIVPLEWRGQRVLTTKQLAAAYYCEDRTLNGRKRKFVEGEHYFKLFGDALKELKSRDEEGAFKGAKSLNLWTKNGAKLQAELRNDIASWNAYEWLAENYFKQAAITEITTPAEPSKETGLQAYVNDTFGKIRGLMIDGKPYFVGKDVASALGYTDTKQAVRKHVDEEDKLGRQIDTSGQRREMTLINESGLYSLILSSKLPSAKSFKRWVTAEVLPSIRETGEYKVATAETLIKPSEMVLEIGATRDAIKKVFGVEDAIREGMALAQATDIVTNRYNFDYPDLKKLIPPATHDVGFLTPKMIGAKMGKSAQAINAMLRAQGLQYKDNKGNWHLTAAGTKYGEMIPFTNRDTGHSGYYIAFNEKVFEAIDEPRLPF